MQDPSGLRFLIAAKQGEIAELLELQRTVDLVQSIANLVHQLQRERGLSNLYVASGGQRFAAERSVQMADTDAATAQADAQLGRLDPAQAALPAGQGSRLYARIAQALQAQAAVPALRASVEALQMDVTRLTRDYMRIVAAWLAVVFEAADIAADADVSRRLVSLFHLTQAKELVGQERAAGSALFAAGQVLPDDRLRLQDLGDAQERGLASFETFAADAALAAWVDARAHPSLLDRQRLRRLLLNPSGHGALNPGLSMPWFEACTAWMDGLRKVEDLVLADLRRLCATKCASLEQEVSALLGLSSQADGSSALLTAEQALVLLEAGTPVADEGFGRGLSAEGAAWPAPAGRHVATLVRSQAERLGAMTAELDAARAALQERKLIERAKGVLMAQASMTEDQAHQALRRLAMDQGRRLVEVAESLLRRTH